MTTTLAAPAQEGRRTAGILAVSVTTAVWGLAPLVVKQSHMPVLTFAAYRLWAGVLIFVVVFAVTGRRLTWATLRTCALGGVIFTADVACSFLAFRLTAQYFFIRIDTARRAAADILLRRRRRVGAPFPAAAPGRRPRPSPGNARRIAAISFWVMPGWRSRRCSSPGTFCGRRSGTEAGNFSRGGEI